MSASILSLREFGVSLNARPILRDLDLEIPCRGISSLMGPGGAGKSTLVRTVCGLYEGSPELVTSGQCLYIGAPTRPGHLPALVDQRLSISMSTGVELLASNLPQRAALTRPQQRELFRELAASLGADSLIDQIDRPCVELSLADRRRLVILRATLAAPPLLCVDEPTADLDEADSARITDMLARYAERAAVLFVTHHLSQARALSTQITLLAGGRVVETSTPAHFFERSRHPMTRDYVRTGNCCAPSLEAETEPSSCLNEQTRPADGGEEMGDERSAGVPRRVPSLDRLPSPRLDAPSDAVGPRGFRWLIPGRLAGTPQPGLLRDVRLDIEALQRAGVTVLVSLIEQPLELPGLRCIPAPIPDMHAPSIEEAARLCAEISVSLAQGEVVAYHCKAGLGRTGTLLAAQLIWGGLSYEDARAQLRALNPHWIQSAEQENFLAAFGAWCAGPELETLTPTHA